MTTTKTAKLPRTVAQLREAATAAMQKLDPDALARVIQEAHPHELWTIDNRPQIELHDDGTASVKMPGAKGARVTGNPGPLSAAIDVMHLVNQGHVFDAVLLELEKGLERLDANGHWDGLQRAVNEIVKRPRYAWHSECDRSVRTFRLRRINPELADLVVAKGRETRGRTW